MNNKASFTDILSILLKWKRFIIINLIIIAIIATTVAYVIPETFKATSRVILAENSSGLGGLSSLISGNSALSFGADILGVSSSGNEDLIFGLLNSRTVLEKVVNKFNLYDYYDEAEEKNLDKLIKKFEDDLLFDPNEYGVIEISVINENPQLSADIANYFVYLADSMNIDLMTRTAINNRILIEKRYNKNIEDLRLAEDDLYKFQKKNGIFVVPEQIEASVKAAAEIEAMLVQKEVMLELVKNTNGTESPNYRNILTEVNILRGKINELKYSDKLSSTSNILFPFKKVPDLVIKYYRLFRKVEIQSKILEFILPLYEQAKVEETKNLPTLLIIDKAQPPQYKYAPKKAAIILGAIIFVFLILSFIVLRAESLCDLESLNLFNQKEKRFYRTLFKIFGLNY